MTIQRSILALTISVPLLAVGCSSEPAGADMSTRRGTAAQTTGSQRRAETARGQSVTQADQRRMEENRMERERMERERMGQTEGDRMGMGAPTATDQSDAPSDLEITRQVRAAVVGDSSLSMTARNVTIITRDSVVTLRGNVSSNAERETIDHHARQVAGVRRVENMLDVADGAE